jgi:CxxC motif-containing protein
MIKEIEINEDLIKKNNVQLIEKDNIEFGKKSITCIVCPMGCSLEISYKDGKVTDVSGYTCKRGLDYGWTESTNPVRILTTTVRVENGRLPVLPVKSEKPLPKDLLFECIKVINSVMLEAPVAYGDIIVENILDTGVNIIAVKSFL